jgi:hypothetical protein
MWRLKLREADEAFRGGRLEEAGKLLRDGDLQEFLPAKRLLAKVARGFAQRARRRMEGDQSSAGWRDMETARSLGADPETLAELGRAFVQRRLEEARSYVVAGEPATALARLDDLLGRQEVGREARQLREAAALSISAERHARRGLFADAERELSSAAALIGGLDALEDARKACKVKSAECRKLTERLHESLATENWTAALTAAEGILEICPDHEPAREARRRAWATVGMGLDDRGRTIDIAHRASPIAAAVQEKVIVTPTTNGRPAVRIARLAGNSPVNATSTASNEPGSRFLLWVDGVGGYLVCESDRVTLGQPVPGSQVDVPILGDVSRRHAQIRRDGEAYLIDPLRPVQLDGKTIERRTSLVDGNLIELGHNVRLRFRRPHPLSATARLEFVSHHRTQPAADAVLLMAESCVLGPNGNSHVVCRNWSNELVLFRQAGVLHCRRPGQFTIDGVDVEGKGALAATSQIVGHDFSLSVEVIS